MNKRTHQDLVMKNGGAKGLDLLCLSHLRWNFVYQRPQHLLSRAAKHQRVFFFEEPFFHDGAAYLELRPEEGGPLVAVPHLPHGLSEAEHNQALRKLLDELLVQQNIKSFISWYYTPMALKFSRHLKPELCVYDCMDQLSHFKGASREIPLLEQELFRKSDLVFTGGQSLYEAKREEHHSVHAFPSSVDVQHFIRARSSIEALPGHPVIKGPKIGYLGVIDERLDIELLDAVARQRPDWNLVMVGPIVKIDPASLPRYSNVHYLGPKTYAELPYCLADWDIAMLPFARNDATRYISPTKTPEYLSAGCRVISTSIRDVVYPYGEKSLVSIADDAATFIACAEAHLAQTPTAREQWLKRVDLFLASQSWDRTFDSMWRLMDKGLERGSSLREATRNIPRYPQPQTHFSAEISGSAKVKSGSSTAGGKIAMAPG